MILQRQNIQLSLNPQLLLEIKRQTLCTTPSRVDSASLTYFGEREKSCHPLMLTVLGENLAVQPVWA